MATEPATTEFTLDTAQLLAEEEHGRSIVGRSPWYLAWRRLRRNKVALTAFALFVLVVAVSAAAPLYADHVAHTTASANHPTENVKVGSKIVPVISQGGTYTDPKTHELRVKPVNIIGPTWWHAGGKFVLGADENGRDNAVRLLYGGRNSLIVGVGSAFLCTLFAVILALIAGYYGGVADWVITRFFDLIWAFPVILLAIALGAALSINGLHWNLRLFHVNLESGSLWIPTIVISYVLIPYIGRPLRGQILSLREKEFVEAAVAQGAGPLRIMFGEILPNIASSALVFFTLVVANNILLEAALSFLGAGIQDPNPSWGKLISEGQDRILTAPWLTITPGIAIVVTVVALNIFGDGLRDALDPRAKVRIEH
ncbi:MAG TPA: ABC transporter permease [Gaiellaceae bacterium]